MRVSVEKMAFIPNIKCSGYTKQVLFYYTYMRGEGEKYRTLLAYLASTVAAAVVAIFLSR